MVSSTEDFQLITDANTLPDGHNDLLITIRQVYKNHIYSPDFTSKFQNGGFVSHVDLPRLDAGQQGGAFWSAFMPCPVTGNGTDFSDSQYDGSTLCSLLSCIPYIYMTDHP